MKQNNLDFLQKILKLTYPDNYYSEYKNTIDNILENYMGLFGLQIYTKRKTSWYDPLDRYKLLDKDIITKEQLSSDLFSIIKYKPNIFSKSIRLIVQKQDNEKTISELLSHNDKNIINIFESFCKKFKQQLYQVGKQKLYNKLKNTKKANTEKRGNYYLNGLNYPGPNMINPKQICLVHATNFYPNKNQDGKYFIETTAHAMDYLTATATVHFTCNHIVESHMNGSWDNMPYIIMAPLHDIVDINGKPRRFAAVDTYFLPDPDKGVIMPNSVMIVEPSDNLPDNKLFQITPNNHCYYRRKNFSTVMIKELSTNNLFYDKDELQKNDNYLAMLSRNFATKALMEQNGFHYISSPVFGNLDIMSDYAYTGKNLGFQSVDHQYSHASDQETFQTNHINQELTLLSMVENGEKILDEHEINILKNWIKKHILSDTPIKILETDKSDTPELKKLKDKYNLACAKFVKKLQKQISTESDMKAYLKRISASRN